MSTPGTLDHLRPWEDSLVVPPGDAAALAEAIGRLDRDDGLLRTLARGAVEAGAGLSTRAWAREVVHGARRVRWT